MIDCDRDDFVDAQALKGKVDHSTAGAQLVWRELSKQGAMGRIVGQVLALCIASHHSGLIDCLSSDLNSPVEDRFSRRMGKQDDRTHLREAESKMDLAIEKRFSALIAMPGLVGSVEDAVRKIVAADKVKVIAEFKVGLLVRFLFSCLIDAESLDTANFEKPRTARYRPGGKYTEWSVLSDRLEKHLQAFVSRSPLQESLVNAIRRSISDHCRDAAIRDKGIYSLSAPTGGGKTLASLRFALHHAEHHSMDRVIYAIPFTSIIDQNADAVRKRPRESAGEHRSLEEKRHKE